MILFVKRCVSVLLSLLSLAIAFVGLAAFWWQPGFPDGHITEYERAMQQVVVIAGVLLVGVAGYFIAGGWFVRPESRARHLLIGLGVLVTLLLLLMVINQLALDALNSGQGG